LSNWSIPLDKLAEKAQADLETVARKVTFDLYSSVVYMSPVDTGRFRANWNVSVDSVDTATSQSTDKNRASTEVAKVLELPVGGVYFLSNSLPYAQVLEYGLYPNPPKHPTGKTVNGYSRQAPAGFVRVSVVRFNEFVQKAIKK